MKTFIPVALSAALLAGVPAAVTARQATMPAPADATPTQARPFVMMAGASDLYEIQSSRMALTKARTKAVRDFAQMMITHHAKTTRDVTTAAVRAGLRPMAPKLTPMQASNIAKLRPLSGAAFEREYITQQVAGHEMALALHQNYAASGDTPQLKTAAQGAVPIVQQHLDRARTIQSSM